jgi:Ca2+-binding EF-hand superfamily protein
MQVEEEASMSKTLRLALAVFVLCTIGGWTGIAVAQAPEQNLEQGEMTTAELLTLMDKDRNGKISRQEFMDFMSAEFDRLDVNKDGELDPDELKNLLHRVGHNAGYQGAR